jgi:hypothetical protein
MAVLVQVAAIVLSPEAYFGHFPHSLRLLYYLHSLIMQVLCPGTRLLPVGGKLEAGCQYVAVFLYSLWHPESGYARQRVTLMKPTKILNSCPVVMSKLS